MPQKQSKTFESWQDTGLVGIAIQHTDHVELVLCEGIRVSGEFPYFPVITGVSTHNTKRGSIITISGTGFGTIKKTSSLLFGGKTMKTDKWTEISIRALIPNDAKTGKITMVTPYGTVTYSQEITVNIN